MSLAVQSLNHPQMVTNYFASKQSNKSNQVKNPDNVSFTGLFKKGTKAGVLAWEILSYVSAAGALAIGVLLDTHVISVGHALEPIQKTIFSYTHMHVSPSWAAYAETVWASIQGVGCTIARRKLNRTK